MSYQTRLRKYEFEKQQLNQMNLSPAQYQQALIVLANRWKV